MHFLVVGKCLFSRPLTIFPEMSLVPIFFIIQNEVIKINYILFIIVFLFIFN